MQKKWLIKKKIDWPWICSKLRKKKLRQMVFCWLVCVDCSVLIVVYWLIAWLNLALLRCEHYLVRALSSNHLLFESVVCWCLLCNVSFCFVGVLIGVYVGRWKMNVAPIYFLVRCELSYVSWAQFGRSTFCVHNVLSVCGAKFCFTFDWN